MEKVLFGNLKNGDSIYAYTIKNDVVEVVILDYGATVQSFKYKGKDIVLGYDDAISYEIEDGYLGACVGRVANRVAKAKFTLDGIEYSLDKNDGENSLHGGFDGISNKIWHIDCFNKESVILSVVSLSGEGGFPATVKITVKYTVCKNGLEIEYLAVSDAKTPINLTNHSYFNLNQGKDLKNTTLFVNADYFTPIDKTLIPTGEVRFVGETPFDFRHPKEILKDIEKDDEQLRLANGYDHNFVLNGKGYKKFATLEGESLKMDCFTDREGVQVYSGNFLNGKKGKGGAVYNFRSGICLETQSFPDFVNQANFPYSFVNKDRPYASKTAYIIEEK